MTAATDTPTRTPGKRARIRVRRATEADLPAIADLYKAFWGEQSDIRRMRRELARIATNPDSRVLCACDTGQVAGTLLAVVCRELYGTCRPFMVLEDFVVGATHRRRGVGTALIQSAERFARSRGCATVVLVTERSRRDACAFYRAMGYVSQGRVGFKKRLSYS